MMRSGDRIWWCRLLGFQIHNQTVFFTERNWATTEPEAYVYTVFGAI